MSQAAWWRTLAQTARHSAGVFLRDVGHGLLDVSHNMLALLGLLVVAAALFAMGRADLRATIEQQALGWLQERHAPRSDELTLASFEGASDAGSLAKALATDPASLSRQQAAVTNWLSRRYRVAPEPVARLVQEAWQVGQRAGFEPTLLLAIVAIESSFNPFAQSPVGAQGLMQVMTRVHSDKYDAFGGKLAAFDPVTNLRVGVLVLKECIARAGSLEAGLRYYVGAANLDDDGGYAGKVLSEQRHIAQVAAGQNVPVTVPNLVPPTATTSTTAATSGSPGASAPVAPKAPADELPVKEQVALAAS